MMRYLLFLALLPLLGCASAPKPTLFDRSFAAEQSFDEVWTAVIEAFAANKWPIDDMKKASGLITTDWMTISSRDDDFLTCADCGRGTLGTKRQVVRGLLFKFNVHVKSEGEGSQVRVNCLFKTGDSMECMSHGVIEGRLKATIRSKLAK